MKAQKLKTFLLSTSAFVVVFLTSCSKDKVVACSEQEPTPQEQIDNAESLNKARQQYQKLCSDSVCHANGYDSICAQKTLLWRSACELSAMEDSLEIEHSLGGTITREVETSGNRILDKFFMDADKILDKYSISLSSYFVNGDEFFWCFNTDTQGNDDIMDYVYKRDLIYSGVTLSSYDGSGKSQSDLGFEQFVNIIEYIVDQSNYGEKRKNEIVGKIKTLIEKTKTQLIASRKKIERKYSDYYVLIDGDNIAIEQGGVGDADFGDADYGYYDLNDKQAVVHHQATVVYNTDLPVDFFGDEDAEYKLISLGNNRWYVQKKTANGKIEKTPVFTDKGQINTWEEYAGISVRNSSKFSFEPGQNTGVHVAMTERNVAKRARKPWGVPRSVIDEMNSLEKQVSHIVSQYETLDEQCNRIKHYADSLAIVKAYERFNHQH